MNAETTTVELTARELNIIELALDVEGDRFEQDMYRHESNGQALRAKDAGKDAREHFTLMDKVKAVRREEF